MRRQPSGRRAGLAHLAALAPAGACAGLLLALLPVQDPVVPDQEPAPVVEPAQDPVVEPAVDEAGGDEPSVPGAAAVEPAPPVGRPPFADPVPLESSDPIVSVVGSGAPEVLVWYAGARPGMEELTWRLEIAGAVGELLGEGAGTVHLMTDLGTDGGGLDQVYEYLALRPAIVAVGEVEAGEEPTLRRRPPEPHLDAIKARPGPMSGPRGPEAWIRTGLGLEYGQVERSGSSLAGKWLRGPDGGPWTWSAFRGGTPEQQQERWRSEHSVGPSSLRDAPSDPQDFPSFDTDEPWPAEVTKVEGDLTWTLSGSPVRTAADLAAELVGTLVAPARLEAALAGEPLHLGGDLWQLDLRLDAPTLQVRRDDALRTYPKARLVPSLSWAGPVEGAAIPRLIDVAWQPEGGEFFALLDQRGPGSGRYGFPGDVLPDGATLRLVVSAPGAREAAGRTLFVALDGGRHGRAGLRAQLTGE